MKAAAVRAEHHDSPDTMALFVAIALDLPAMPAADLDASLKVDSYRRRCRYSRGVVPWNRRNSFEK